MQGAKSGVVELGESIRASVGAPRHRPRNRLRVLAEFVAELTDVPARDVELLPACAECGGEHGRPRLEYPTTPSGRHWEVDCLTALDGSTIAVVSERRPIGVGSGTAVAGGWGSVEAALLHPEERAVLDTLDDPRRRQARAAVWARKSALLRLVGHSTVFEPARVIVSTPMLDGGDGRVEHLPAELGAQWRDVRFREITLASGEVVAVAVQF